jgi:hypothetical protein
MLEWVNRLRMDPAGEFDRLVSSISPVASPIPGVASALSYFAVDLGLLRQELSALAAAPPLAWNSALNDAARGHNAAMIAADTQSHQLPGGPSLAQRATSAGYAPFTRLAENVYCYAESVAYAHAGFVIDWGPGTGGMQSPRGHRDSLMNAALREVGIALTVESNPTTRVGPLVVTQDFGTRANQPDPYLLGVAFDDADGDGFYDAGEGLGGVTVRAAGAAGTFTATTAAAGGYQMSLPAGAYTVTFEGGPLAAPVVRSILVGSQNAKLDLERPDPGMPASPVIRFESASYRVTEGGAFSIALIRDGDLSAPVTIRLSTSFGTAGASDLAAPPPISLAFAAGQARAILTLPTADDSLAEPSETFSLRVEPDAGYVLAAPTVATLTILDNDAATPAPTEPPSLVDARLIQSAGGQVQIRLVFSADLAPGAASQRGAYTLRRAGRDRRLGTRDDVRLAPTRVRYDATTRSASLTFAATLRAGEILQLLARPDLLRSPLGLTLAGPSSRTLRAAARR